MERPPDGQVNSDETESAEPRHGRRTARVPVRLAARWIRRDSQDEVMATDVNLHGLFFCTDRKPAPGSLLHMEVPLADRLLRMFVIVRFVGTTISGTGVGVEIFLADDSEAWRQHYLTELARQHPGEACQGDAAQSP